MPAETVVVAAVIAAFAIFMATLAWALIYTWLGERQDRRRPASIAAPLSVHEARLAA